MASLSYLREMRAKAAERGDVSQVRALDADLERSGQGPGRSFGVEPLETTALESLPERAVVERPRRGRPPRPRCEHGNLVDRCHDCSDEAV